MTPVIKKIVVLVAVLAVVAGVYYWYSSQQQGSQQEQGMPASTDNGAQGSVTPSTGAFSDSPVNVNISDLQKDAAAIDAQIKSFNADNAIIDSAIKDKPLPQSSL